MHLAALPGDFPNWQTVYTSDRNWRKDGTWIKLHDRLHAWVRVEHDRAASPKEAIVDSQSVKSAAMVSQTVGYDAAKLVLGRKRHLTVDTLGLVLRVLVTAASVPEREGGKQVLKKVKQMGPAVSRLHTVWVDGGYDGNPFMQWVMDVCRWIVQVVLRPQETKGMMPRPIRSTSSLRFRQSVAARASRPPATVGVRVIVYRRFSSSHFSGLPLKFFCPFVDIGSLKRVCI